MNQSAKILKTVEEIRIYIGGKNPVSRDKFKEFIRLGMPAAQIGNVWYAHADLVDDWFKRRLNLSYAKATDDQIDAAE
jgi:hypothetical protein